MATAEIIHICGHTSKTFGPKAEEFAEQAKNERCEACKEYQRRIGIYPVSNLVELQGSEKQVKWARDIRYHVVKRFHELLERAKVQSMSVSDMETAKDAFVPAVQFQTGAKWWIDHRYDAWDLLTREYEKAFSQK